MNASLLIGVTAAALTYLLYKLIWKTRTPSNAPPCLPYLPIVGSLPFISGLDTLHVCLTDKRKRYGNVYALYAGGTYTAVLNGYDAIHDALVKRSSDFAGRPVIFAEKYVWNPELRGIGTRTCNDEFKRIKQMSFSVLKKLGFGEHRITEAHIDREVVAIIAHISEKNGKAFDLQSILQTSTLNVIYSILFGQRFNAGDQTSKYLINTFGIYDQSLSPSLDLFPFLRFLPRLSKSLRHIEPESVRQKQFFSNKVHEFRMGSSGLENFVTEFIQQAGTQFGSDELAFILRDLVYGATAATAAQLYWAVLLLANNPTIQERLQKEIDSVVSRDRRPSLDDKTKLPYLEATMLEIMRLKTIGPLGTPHATLCDTLAGGFFIPAHTQIVVNIWSAHMDPNVWDKPEEFSPERFLSEDGEVVNRERMIAFSLGKRRCPGENLAWQEMFLILSALIQRFNILPPDGQRSIPDQTDVVPLLIPAPYKARLLLRV